MLYCRCQLNFTFNFRCVNQFELKGTIITRYWQTICEMFFFVLFLICWFYYYYYLCIYFLPGGMFDASF